NQAVCCAKLGAKVQFIGKMGDDVFRDSLVKGMKRDGVDLRYCSFDSSSSTGIALITVEESGENEIVVISGSNMKLRPSDIRKRSNAFAAASVVLLQLETPLETIIEAARLSRRYGAITLLNPAPGKRLPVRLLRVLDYLTPNETEIELMTGMKVRDRHTAVIAAKKLLRIGVSNVIITMGAKGCLLVSAEEVRMFPSYRVRAVDTTAAGDAFSGAFAFSLSRGDSKHEAIRFANAVAACAVTSMGAQNSMPTMAELKRFIAQQK
ncbi:MAG TPA: ribokinase, partial [Bacteroidota bacterium]